MRTWGLPPGQEKKVAAALKSTLSTGGTIKGSTLELQGDHREKVQAWLKANVGSGRKEGR